MKIQKWIDENCQSLKGKRIAITGSTGGLGRHICSIVAKLGGELILLDRNQERSNAHAEELKSNYAIETKSIVADMVEIGTVKKACEQLKNENIDILILNAGAYSLPREKSSEGYDQVFQINFLSPYYIVKEMLSSIRERGGKVVVVGSIAHKYSNINEADVDFSSVKAPRKVYGNAKRFLMFSLFERFKKEEKVSLSIAHPGITPTNITSHYPKWIRKVIKYPMKWIFSSPQKACLNIVKAMFENCPAYTWIGPRKFNIWGSPKLKKLNSCEKEEGQKIFEIAEKTYERLRS